MVENSQKPDQGTHYHLFDVLAKHFYEEEMLTPNNVFKMNIDYLVFQGVFTQKVLDYL